MPPAVIYGPCQYAGYCHGRSLQGPREVSDAHSDPPEVLEKVRARVANSRDRSEEARGFPAPIERRLRVGGMGAERRLNKTRGGPREASLSISRGLRYDNTQGCPPAPLLQEFGHHGRGSEFALLGGVNSKPQHRGSQGPENPSQFRAQDGHCTHA